MREAVSAWAGRTSVRGPRCSGLENVQDLASCECRFGVGNVLADLGPQRVLALEALLGPEAGDQLNARLGAGWNLSGVTEEEALQRDAIIIVEGRANTEV